MLSNSHGVYSLNFLAQLPLSQLNWSTKIIVLKIRLHPKALLLSLASPEENNSICHQLSSASHASTQHAAMVQVNPKIDPIYTGGKISCF